MNQKQVHRFVQQYLESTGCHIIEKSPAHFVVKLSPEADRMLTNRPYYWSFVDRTGAEPETMSFLLVTDKEKYELSQQAADAAVSTDNAPASGSTPRTAGTVTGTPPLSPGASVQAAVNSALARSYGIVPSQLLSTPRLPRDDVHFGSKRLLQLFDAVQSRGSYVYLFQEPDTRSRSPFQSTPYTPWLGVNLKVEFQCDRKREELYSFGVSLATGHCRELFHEQLSSLKMTPRLPSNVHIAPAGITLNKAIHIVEMTLERKLKAQCYRWAEEAQQRLDEEQKIVSHYYDKLLQSADEELKAEITRQYDSRKAEIDWQYRPRVTATAINCGIFHLQGIE